MKSKMIIILCGVLAGMVASSGLTGCAVSQQERRWIQRSSFGQ